MLFRSPALALLAAALVTTPVAAQQHGGMARPGLHILNPSMSLSSPATSPLDQQMQQNYATQLMQTQRALLQRNPSGVTRQELAIGNTLNGYTGPR